MHTFIEYRKLVVFNTDACSFILSLRVCVLLHAFLKDLHNKDIDHSLLYHIITFLCKRVNFNWFKLEEYEIRTFSFIHKQCCYNALE